MRIRKRDLINIFFRSFAIQAAWNCERMLGLGLCFCLVPIVKRLFTDKQKQIDFLKRHIGFFNSHPYLANYALGAIIKIEEQNILKNWENPRAVENFKNRVIGPLGAIGDTFFWQLTLPALALLGVFLAYFFGQSGALTFFVLYNIVHIFIRARGLINGFIKGFDIIRDLSLSGTKKYFKIIKVAVSILLGTEIILISFRIFHLEQAPKEAILFLASLIFSFFVLRQRKISVDVMVIIVIFVSIIIGFII